MTELGIAPFQKFNGFTSICTLSSFFENLYNHQIVIPNAVAKHAKLKKYLKKNIFSDLLFEYLAASFLFLVDTILISKKLKICI